jgi:Na+-translocating ferredoxin:NAD+ oxidoreductase RnfC subunit
VNPLAQIRRAGVIGAGGAGFPTHQKLRSRTEIVIANGAECEPLLQSDKQLISHYAEEIVRGVEIAMTLTSAPEGIIAVKDLSAQAGKYHEAIAAVEEALRRTNRNIRLHLLKDTYPAGDEHVLVFETTGRIVPEGGLPLDIGCVVQNVATLRNVFRALENQPVTSRFVTVIGAVHKPRTLHLPIGTLVEDAIALCGGATAENVKVIDGGPMMGVPSRGYVNKTTTGLLVLPREHNLVREASLPARTGGDELRHRRASMSLCDQCFACTEVCPRYLLGHRLEPHVVMRDVANGISLARNKHFLAMSYLCCHCDLCRVWGCPVDLAPGKVMFSLKEDLRRARIENPYLPPDHIGAGVKAGRQLPRAIRGFRDGRRPSVGSLIPRLGLTHYDIAAPLVEKVAEVHRVRLSLRQPACTGRDIGAPSVPQVSIGERVRLGDVIADVKTTDLGVPLHASIPGVITDVTDEFIEIHTA